MLLQPDQVHCFALCNEVVKMKYYSRKITKREPINRFGKLGFVLYKEMVKTNDIDKFNKNKRIKFAEDEEARKYLYHKDKNRVYCEVV